MRAPANLNISQTAALSVALSKHKSYVKPMKGLASCAAPDLSRKLQKFKAEGLDVELFTVSPADAAAEAFANQDNQVYFGKGQISLREGPC